MRDITLRRSLLSRARRAMTSVASVAEIERRLRRHANEVVARHAQRFFRAEPGGYGEGDCFLGVRVPQVRSVARELRAVEADTAGRLLDSKWHEVRLLAVILLAQRYAKAEDAERD